MSAQQPAMIHIDANPAFDAANDILLSVLVPFYNDNPVPLARALSALIADRSDIEIVLYDDGKPNAGLNGAVVEALKVLDTPARLLTSLHNTGRSAGRNILTGHANGRWLLFLDADMTPGHSRFLTTYLDALREDNFDAAFGGYETDMPSDPAHLVHAALSHSSDQKSAASRQLIGPTAFCSSNLLVRARVMRDVKFDESFTGWGWEDVDWAVRAARVHTLVHIDNPAGHAGLQATDILLDKFQSGASNYARLLAKHPQLSRLPGARAARMLGVIPFQGLFRGLWAVLVRSDNLPLKIRTSALKLWRASWTAEAI
jgi:glycosyltransferase involved in cell wall biosynthesis